MPALLRVHGADQIEANFSKTPTDCTFVRRTHPLMASHPKVGYCAPTLRAWRTCLLVITAASSLSLTRASESRYVRHRRSTVSGYGCYPYTHIECRMARCSNRSGLFTDMRCGFAQFYERSRFLQIMGSAVTPDGTTATAATASLARARNSASGSGSSPARGKGEKRSRSVRTYIIRTISTVEQIYP